MQATLTMEKTSSMYCYYQFLAPAVIVSETEGAMNSASRFLLLPIPLKNLKLIKFKMAIYRPLFTSTGLILRNIMKTAQDSYTITIKQIVRFQERMHYEKFQLYQIQNGRLSAIIHLDRPDIG